MQALIIAYAPGFSIASGVAHYSWLRDKAVIDETILNCQEFL